MNPLNALADFAVGLIHEGHVQAWCRLAASLAVTAFVSFFGTLSASVISQVQLGAPAGIAIVLGLAHASGMMALMVLAMWTKSPMTKGIPILYPSAVEAKRIEQLAKEGGTVYVPNDKR